MEPYLLSRMPHLTQCVNRREFLFPHDTYFQRGMIVIQNEAGAHRQGMATTKRLLQLSYTLTLTTFLIHSNANAKKTIKWDGTCSGFAEKTMSELPKHLRPKKTSLVPSGLDTVPQLEITLSEEKSGKKERYTVLSTQHFENEKDGTEWMLRTNLTRNINESVEYRWRILPSGKCELIHIFLKEKNEKKEWANYFLTEDHCKSIEKDTPSETAHLSEHYRVNHLKKHLQMCKKYQEYFHTEMPTAAPE